MEERAAKATTRATATAATADTHARINGLGVSAASTSVARTQTTIPHPFGLMLLASLFPFIFQLAAGKRKEGRGPNRVYCCLTPTCAIRQRHRGQAKLEGAMVRATRQAHSRVARSPECAVDHKISGNNGINSQKGSKKNKVQVKKKKTKTKQKTSKKILQAKPLGIDAGRVQGRHRAHLTAAGQAGLPGARAKSRAHAL